MGVPVPPYRLFLLISAGLHLAVLSLLPAEVVVEVVSLGAHPGAVPLPGPVAHDLVLLDGTTPLQVVEIAVQTPATARAGQSQASSPALTPPAVVPSAVATAIVEPPPERPPAVVAAGAGNVAADAAPTGPSPGAPDAADRTDRTAAAGASGSATDAAATGATGAAAGDEREAVLRPPVAVALVWPEIEPDGRRAGQTPVELLVHVTASGEVSDVRVVTPTGCAACEAAAVEAARRLRFRPAMRGSTPVAVWWPFTFEFRR
jgi:protein TonB